MHLIRPRYTFRSHTSFVGLCDCSATHRALSCQDIIAAIVQKFEASNDVLSFQRTTKLFFHEASRAIWRNPGMLEDIILPLFASSTSDRGSYTFTFMILATSTARTIP